MIQYLGNSPDGVAAGIVEKINQGSKVNTLSCPMIQPNDAEAATVGEFLTALLRELWIENEGFSGKRPLGNSDWQGQVYSSLAKAGFISMTFDEDGYIEDFEWEEEDKADKLILNAIDSMRKGWE